MAEAVLGSHRFAPDCAALPLRRAEVLGWKGRPVSERVAGMSMDTELQKHYALLLGIGSLWEVKTVELKLGEKKVEFELGWQWGQSAQCPECGRPCSIHDSAPERTWRHTHQHPNSCISSAIFYQVVGTGVGVGT